MNQWALDQGLGILHYGSWDYRIPFGLGVDPVPFVLRMHLCRVGHIAVL